MHFKFKKLFIFQNITLKTKRHPKNQACKHTFSSNQAYTKTTFLSSNPSHLTLFSVNLMREFLEARREMRQRNQLPVYWERVIRRLEAASLSFYLILILLDVFLLVWPELWY